MGRNDQSPHPWKAVMCLNISKSLPSTQMLLKGLETWTKNPSHQKFKSTVIPLTKLCFKRLPFYNLKNQKKKNQNQNQNNPKPPPPKPKTMPVWRVNSCLQFRIKRRKKTELFLKLGEPVKDTQSTTLLFHSSCLGFHARSCWTPLRMALVYISLSHSQKDSNWRVE